MLQRFWTSGRLTAAILVGLSVLAFPSAATGASVPDSAFVEEAVGAYLGAAGSALPPGEIEVRAAAVLLDFRANPGDLGRLWVRELMLAGGEAGLARRASEEAAGSGETPRSALARLVTEAARRDGKAMLRATARLYASVWSEASPSRLRMADLEAGALDAAPPAPMTVRHRSFVSEGETDSLRLAWPADGGDGAAVVRYEDPELPADVVFFAAGDRRTIPIAGVARIDFLVAGGDSGDRGLEAPVEIVRDAAAPFWRLEARAEAGAYGPRLSWSTASHENLRGWAVFREEVAADGRIVRNGPEVVPSSETAAESFAYAFVDTSAASETFYRYTVWAVTGDGLLSKAFAVTLDSGRLEPARPRRD